MGPDGRPTSRVRPKNLPDGYSGHYPVTRLREEVNGVRAGEEINEHTGVSFLDCVPDRYPGRRGVPVSTLWCDLGNYSVNADKNYKAFDEHCGTLDYARAGAGYVAMAAVRAELFQPC